MAHAAPARSSSALASPSATSARTLCGGSPGTPELFSGDVLKNWLTLVVCAFFPFNLWPSAVRLPLLCQL